MPEEEAEDEEAGERGGMSLLGGLPEGELLLLPLPPMLLSRNMRVLDLERRASVLLEGGGWSPGYSQIGRVRRPW